MDRGACGDQVVTFQIMGTAHLGQARCICGSHPEGCPLHQHAVQIDYERIPDEGVELGPQEKLPGFPPFMESMIADS